MEPCSQPRTELGSQAAFAYQGPNCLGRLDGVGVPPGIKPGSRFPQSPSRRPETSSDEGEGASKLTRLGSLHLASTLGTAPVFGNVTRSTAADKPTATGPESSPL